MTVKNLLLLRLLLCVLMLFTGAIAAASAPSRKAHINSEDCTDVARGPETLLVFATLDGGMTAIDPITSQIRWTIADDPPIAANQKDNVRSMQYLPNPRDGSIYQRGNLGHLTKMQYTIPQLVANSPCRSRDGILYSGKKSDTWYIIDPKTGQREKVLGFGEGVKSKEELREQIGWATSRGVYLGRTQYTVMMHDSLSGKKNVKPWNITFYDYYSHSTTPELERDYEYIHLTTTTNGKLVTLDRKNGSYLWENDLGSPIVSSFLLGPDGLLSVPFTILSDEVFNTLLEQSKIGNVNAVQLFESLYVGLTDTGLYALPSLVDGKASRLSVVPPVKLLGGAFEPPKDATIDVENNSVHDIITDEDSSIGGIVLGHYDVPSIDTARVIGAPKCRGDVHDLAPIYKGSGALTADQSIVEHTDIRIPPSESAEQRVNRTPHAIVLNSMRLDWLFMQLRGLSDILTVIVFLVIAAFSGIAINWWHRNHQRYSSTSSVGSNKSVGHDTVISNLIDLGNGLKRVGKIAFHEEWVLGTGTAGTVVFKGRFETRTVAVKRLLPDLFNLADREVALLGESDTHENVVRYFCTEQDPHYRYIAVELCQATLEDYTVGKNSAVLRQQITVSEVLLQSATGLSHLHSLSIVHRDIKPHNVLISFPDVSGRVRVMISDFGLSRKLTVGEISASNVSGVTGTYGWLAPEMQLRKKFTTAVDVYSLGCVYFYILSNGHMFEDGNCDLMQFANSGDKAYYKMILANQLVAEMLNEQPDKRPPARSITKHPLLWSDAEILTFLETISDRVESMNYHVEPLKSLESSSKYMLGDDGWLKYVDDCIKNEITDRRTYNGKSVKHLLRVIRNKKHHYEELADDIKQMLGSLPHGYLNYWISRFPHLLSHVYHACNIWSNDTALKCYYDETYKFASPADVDFTVGLSREFLDSLPPQFRRSPSKNNGMDGTTKPIGRQYKGAYNFKKNKVPDVMRGKGIYRNVTVIQTAEEATIVPEPCETQEIDAVSKQSAENENKE